MITFFNIIVKLIPFIFELVRSAEILCDKEKAGAEKKAAVKAGVSAMFEGAKAASTGGQKETLDKASPLADALIDKGIDLAAALIDKK